MTIAEFNTAKKRIEDAKQQQAKAQGAYEQAMEQLKSFGVTEIGDADRLLAEYRKRKEKDEQELNALLAEFEKLVETA